MAGTALIDVRDGVATLTLNRPDALNALSEEMMVDLSAAARELVQRKDFAVLVVKVDAGIDAEALDQAIGAAVTSADEMERELAGDPDSDEF